MAIDYFAQKLCILGYTCVHLILEIRLFLLYLCLLKLKGCHAHSLTGGAGKLLFCVSTDLDSLQQAVGY